MKCYSLKTNEWNIISCIFIPSFRFPFVQADIQIDSQPARQPHSLVNIFEVFFVLSRFALLLWLNVHRFPFSKDIFCLDPFLMKSFSYLMLWIFLQSASMFIHLEKQLLQILYTRKKIEDNNTKHVLKQSEL